MWRQNVCCFTADIGHAFMLLVITGAVVVVVVVVVVGTFIITQVVLCAYLIVQVMNEAQNWS